MQKAHLQEVYETTIRPDLRKKLGLSNVMQVPRVTKIVVNVGVKEAVADSKVLQSVVKVIAQITGQQPTQTIAHKSVAAFKIREGMPLGVMVTLRRDVMYDFLYRLINLALPMVRDFQGVSDKLDRRGNYNLGIRDWTIFPEVDYSLTDKANGMNITIHTTSDNDEHAYELLKAFGMPFKKKK